MAQNFLKKTKKYINRVNLQESYATIILGGIIIIVLGLLVANYFTKRNQIGTVDESTGKSPIAQDIGEYKIAQGDSLSKLAEKYFENRDFWPVLARVNNIKNPNLIYVDSTIKIPSKDEAQKLRELMTQTSYKVEEGDTLFKIAQQLYGDGSKWTVIAKANKTGRLPNGNPLIFTGSTLVIPR